MQKLNVLCGECLGRHCTVRGTYLLLSIGLMLTQSTSRMYCGVAAQFV